MADPAKRQLARCAGFDAVKPAVDATIDSTVNASVDAAFHTSDNTTLNTAFDPAIDETVNRLNQSERTEPGAPLAPGRHAANGFAAATQWWTTALIQGVSLPSAFQAGVEGSDLEERILVPLQFRLSVDGA